MRLHRSLLIVVVLSGAVAAGGALWWQKIHRNELPAWIARANGRLEMTRTDIAVKYDGRLQELLVHEGDTVTAGQIIGQQETTDAQPRLDAATAQYQRAQAALGRAEAERGVRTAQAAQARLEWTQSTKLRAANMVSTVELEQRRLALGSADAAVQAATEAIAEARAVTQDAAANVAKAKSFLNDMTIVAPIAGRVEYRIVEPGSVLPAGGKLVALLNPDDTYLTIFVPAAVAGRIRLGDAAYIRPEGFSELLPVRISFVSPMAQFTPKFVETSSEREKLSYRVKLQLPLETARRYAATLKSGMTADGYLLTDPAKTWSAFPGLAQ